MFIRVGHSLSAMLLIQHAQKVEKGRKALADTILDQVNDIALNIENANKKLWSPSNHPIRGTIVLLHLAMISKLLNILFNDSGAF